MSVTKSQITNYDKTFRNKSKHTRPVGLDMSTLRASQHHGSCAGGEWLTTFWVLSHQLGPQCCEEQPLSLVKQHLSLVSAIVSHTLPEQQRLLVLLHSWNSTQTLSHIAGSWILLGTVIGPSSFLFDKHSMHWACVLCQKMKLKLAPAFFWLSWTPIFCPELGKLEVQNKEWRKSCFFGGLRLKHVCFGLGLQSTVYLKWLDGQHNPTVLLSYRNIDDIEKPVLTCTRDDRMRTVHSRTQMITTSHLSPVPFTQSLHRPSPMAYLALHFCLCVYGVSIFILLFAPCPFHTCMQKDIFS